MGANVHNPQHFPLGMLAILMLAIVACIGAGVWYATRRAALRAWETFAREIGGEFKAKNRVSPERIFGTLHERPFVLETAISHEDDAPYYHTRGAFPLRNPGGFILGARRKSLLEEAQTRHDSAPFSLEDPEFERRFFVVCNDAQNLPGVLSSDVRRELSRYSDIELYVRLNELEWRRAGELSDMKAIRRLNTLLSDVASTIEALPARRQSLSERLAAEELIAKGV